VIFGVGTDVVEIDRIRKALERWGERFAGRILSPSELKRFNSHRQPANWHGVWVVNQRSGKPELQFSEPLIELLSTHGITRSHLSLADERGIAVATVILECAK